MSEVLLIILCVIFIFIYSMFLVYSVSIVINLAFMFYEEWNEDYSLDDYHSDIKKIKELKDE